MEVLDQVLAFLASVSGPALVIIAGVVEFALRFVKSEKPLSILHLVAAGARKVAKILESIANLLDKVLPQKLK